MKMYAPKLFYSLMQLEQDILPDFHESLNFFANEKQFLNATALGKSDDFIIFSHDNKLVFKTMKKEEFKIFKSMS